MVLCDQFLVDSFRRLSASLQYLQCVILESCTKPLIWSPHIPQGCFTGTGNHTLHHGQWASYQIRKIAGCACAENAGNVFPRGRLHRKPLASDPGMHHGTCVTHVPWCMSGSLTRGGGENVPGIPGACAPAILRIWQEANEVTPKNIGEIDQSQTTTQHNTVQAVSIILEMHCITM